MYSTCLFCHAGLGANEAIEQFPVGRRLAFDAAKGRLWVVCRSCARWNLTPLESRWEAIEECERIFRDTRTRVSTDNIGLARLREGTTLVRIGDPQRPEMAAWRYGDQFRRRRWKYAAMAGATVAGVGAVAVAGPVLGLLTWTSAFTTLNAVRSIGDFRAAARVPVGDRVVRLSKLQLQSAQIRPDVGRGFVIHFMYGAPSVRERFSNSFLGITEEAELHGGDAVRAARILLPRINKAGGRLSDVAAAVSHLESARSLSAMFSDAARTPREALVPWKRPMTNWGGTKGPFVLASSLPTPVRLALEMALHEDDERRALEGELAELEERWREAEAIAAIADDLLVPTTVSDMMAKLRG